MPEVFWAMNVPLERWMIEMAQGWHLPWIVEPMNGHHGAWAVMLTREDEPTTTKEREK